MLTAFGLGLGTIVGVVLAIWGIIHWKSLKTPWQLEVNFTSDEEREKQKCNLKNQQKIALGDDGISSIYCPGEDIRGYLERQGNQLYLRPTKKAPIYLRGREVTQPTKIDNQRLKINCPDESKENKDFDIVIQIIKK